jgi:hypothetical protein
MNVTIDDGVLTYEDGTSESAEDFARRVLTGELLEQRELYEALQAVLDTMETPRSQKASAAWQSALVLTRRIRARDAKPTD